MKRMTQDELRAYLGALEGQHGRLTAAVVADDALRDDSPLRAHLDVDVERCARRDLIRQARRLIRRVRYIPHETEVVTLRAPFYVHDPVLPAGESGYSSVASLRDDEGRARMAVAAEFSRAESALRRALAVSEVLGLTGEIEVLVDRISALARKISQNQRAA